MLGRTIAGVFAASAFGSSDHLLAALGARDTASFVRLWQEDPQRFAKALMLLSLDCKLPIDVEVLFAAPPQLALLAYLNLLSAKPSLPASPARRRRERLLELAPRLTPAEHPHARPPGAALERLGCCAPTPSAATSIASRRR